MLVLLFDEHAALTSHAAPSQVAPNLRPSR
jgi:hypothetical protein